MKLIRGKPMNTYRCKENHSIIITSDGVVDPKFKTVLVTYSDGKTKLLSSSTLKNQWEIVTNPTTPNLGISPLF